MNITYNKWEALWTGALIGITGSTISMISNKIINRPLGYGPMGIKNFVWVGITTGVSMMGVIQVKDTAEQLIVSIVREVNK